MVSKDEIHPGTGARADENCLTPAFGSRSAVPRRILVVDDEPDNAHLARSLLESWGYRVEIASDGHQALMAARIQMPDLIILDVQMEGLGGPAVCERLKNNYATQSIPIILLTVHDQVERKIEGLRSGADDYVLKTVDPLELRARIEMVLRRTREQSNANPLTKLPGNVAIERVVDERFHAGELFSVCYCDIDHFKAFNDRYGYEAGDRVILHTARLIARAVARSGGGRDFVGHIGGDDFVLITLPEREADLCRGILADFDGTVADFYAPEERHAGCVRVEDRFGAITKFPLMSLTIAAVNNVGKRFRDPRVFAERATEIKKYLKQFEGSNYLSDRRKSDRGKPRRRGAAPPRFG